MNNVKKRQSTLFLVAGILCVLYGLIRIVYMWFISQAPSGRIEWLSVHPIAVVFELFSILWIVLGILLIIYKTNSKIIKTFSIVLASIEFVYSIYSNRGFFKALPSIIGDKEFSSLQYFLYVIADFIFPVLVAIELSAKTFMKKMWFIPIIIYVLFLLIAYTPLFVSTYSLSPFGICMVFQEFSILLIIGLTYFGLEPSSNSDENKKQTKSSTITADELGKYFELFKNNIITREEYEEIKKKALG